jgi:para-aminobenzoate synthetase component 1
MLYCYNLNYHDPADVMAAMADQDGAVLLDSQQAGGANGRYAVIPIGACTRLRCFGALTEIADAEGRVSRHTGDPFHLLQQELAWWRLHLCFDNDGTVQPPPVFTGGALGLFGYDLARRLETISRDDRPRAIPDMDVRIYQGALVFDPIDQKAGLYCHAAGQDDADSLYETATALLARAGPPSGNPASLHWGPEESGTAYCTKIAHVIEAIYAGDIFQANLSRQFSADLPVNFNAFADYYERRKVMNAPFGAWFNGGDYQLASFSPERFLSAQDGHVTTCPIKGTRPRGSTAAEDARLRDALLASEKDQAENAMIVDLLRNDLSRACCDNSVHVPALNRLESHTRVHHLVSEVCGELAKGYNEIELFRAAFPGGSITGAPKVQAMQIIDKLEGYARGPYCGSLGYISFDKQLDSNILIRTLIYSGGQATLNTGGGITALSSPEEEHDETLAKAAGLIALDESADADTA